MQVAPRVYMFHYFGQSPIWKWSLGKISIHLNPVVEGNGTLQKIILSKSIVAICSVFVTQPSILKNIPANDMAFCIVKWLRTGFLTHSKLASCILEIVSSVVIEIYPAKCGVRISDLKKNWSEATLLLVSLLFAWIFEEPLHRSCVIADETKNVRSNHLTALYN